jgi:hypothetical protein
MKVTDLCLGRFKMSSLHNAICAVSLFFGCGVAVQKPQPVTVVVQAVPKATKPKAGHTYQQESIRILKMLPVQQHQGVYDSGRLGGSNVSDLYALYIMEHGGLVPQKMKIDWNHQLTRPWARKFAITGDPMVRDTGQMLVLEYSRLDPGRMTLEQYQAEAETQARLAYDSLNWEKVGKIYFTDPKTHVINERKLILLKRLANNIHGRTLVAYAMTEILPTSGEFGREYLDFLLRNAGRRYIESLPAIHDSLTSFGPFQFTWIGLSGTAHMNSALPASLRIPSKVTLLRGNMHLRAADLFATANLAMFIRRLDEKQIALFERLVQTRAIDLAQLIATAHNKPTVAYEAGERWLDAKAVPGYQQGCPKASKQYAEKTRANYRALASL